MTDRLSALLRDPKVQEAYVVLNGAMLDFDRGGVGRVGSPLEDVLDEAERQYVAALLAADAALPAEERAAAAMALFAHEYGVGWEAAWERMRPDELRKWLADVDTVAPHLYRALRGELEVWREVAMAMREAAGIPTDETNEQMAAQMLGLVRAIRDHWKERLTTAEAEVARLTAENAETRKERNEAQHLAADFKERLRVFGRHKKGCRYDQNPGSPYTYCSCGLEKNSDDSIEGRKAMGEPEFGALRLCLVCAYEKPWGLYHGPTGVTVCSDCTKDVRDAVERKRLEVLYPRRADVAKLDTDCEVAEAEVARLTAENAEKQSRLNLVYAEENRLAGQLIELAARLATVEGAMRTALSRIDKAMGDTDPLDADDDLLVACQTLSAALVEGALKKHGIHSGKCTLRKPLPFSAVAREKWVCDCGFDAALAGGGDV